MAIRDDVLSDAMIATEKEIAAGAWDESDTGESADASGDRTLEEQGGGLEGQHEPDEDADAEVDETEEAGAEGDEGEGDGDDKPEVKANGEDKSKPEPKPDPKAEPEIPARVPGHRLREQTQRTESEKARADAAEKQLGDLRSQHAADMAALRAQMEQLTSLVRQPAPKADDAKPAEEEMPEVLENPKGFAEYIVKTVQKALAPVSAQSADIRLETSFAIAHAIHKDTFEKAWGELSKLDPKNPDDRVTVQRIQRAQNPGQALIDWHKRTETLRRVGDDPDKFEKDVETRTRESLMKDPDFRKQLLEELKAEAREPGHDGRPRHQLRLPPNLNGAAGRGAASEVQTLDGSEQGVADAAWR